MSAIIQANSTFFQDGQLIRINLTTGKGTLVTATDPIGRWAGITTYQKNWE